MDRKIEAKKIYDNKFELYKQKLEKSGQIIPEDTRKLYKQFKKSQAIEDVKEHDKNLYKSLGKGIETGSYQLIAIITHKGRSAKGGHYIGWTHNTGDRWIEFDDDVVSGVSTQEIMNLRGGSDWHMAYVLIYRKLEI